MPLVLSLIPPHTHTVTDLAALHPHPGLKKPLRSVGPQCQPPRDLGQAQSFSGQPSDRAEGRNQWQEVSGGMMEKLAGGLLDPLGPWGRWPDTPTPTPTPSPAGEGKESGQTGFLCLSPLSKQAKGQVGEGRGRGMSGEPGGPCSESRPRAQGPGPDFAGSRASSPRPGLATTHLGASVFYRFIPYHPLGGGRPRNALLEMAQGSAKLPLQWELMFTTG